LARRRTGGHRLPLHAGDDRALQAGPRPPPPRDPQVLIWSAAIHCRFLSAMPSDISKLPPLSQRKEPTKAAMNCRTPKPLHAGDGRAGEAGPGPPPPRNPLVLIWSAAIHCRFASDMPNEPSASQGLSQRKEPAKAADRERGQNDLLARGCGKHFCPFPPLTILFKLLRNKSF